MNQEEADQDDTLPNHAMAEEDREIYYAVRHSLPLRIISRQ